MGAVEDEKKRKGPVRMSSLFKFHIPYLRVIDFFFIFPRN